MTRTPIATFLGGVLPASAGDTELAFDVGRRIGEFGYALRHGGYNGLMEQAARGASEAGAHVVALTLAGKEEWGEFNPHVKEVIYSPNMGARLMRLIEPADVIIGMGGGVGTLHELTAAIYYAGNVRPVPIVLVGDAACRLHDFLVADRWLYRSPTRPLDFVHTAADLPEFTALLSAHSGFAPAGPRDGRPEDPGDFEDRIRSVATVRGSYALADGTVLDEYFDPFRLACDSALSADVAEVMAQRLDVVPDVVAGLALGGVPLAIDLSRVLRRPLVIVRPHPKAYGTFTSVEGVTVPGQRALLVDDVVRSGRQLTAATRLLGEVGLVVRAVGCFVVRSESAVRSLRQHGINVCSLLGVERRSAGNAGDGPTDPAY